MIKYLFSIGFRCNSVNALKNHGLRKCSGPFDYMYIDLESCFEFISKKFEDFLDPEHIILINKKKSQIMYNTSVDENIISFIKQPLITYMAHDYSGINIIMNTSILSSEGQHPVDAPQRHPVDAPRRHPVDAPQRQLKSNLYDWDRICIFHHHDITETSVRNKISNRCKILNDIYANHKDELCLFHVTKIINNFEIYKEEIKNQIDKYNIKCSMVIIVCICMSFEHKTVQIGKVLFILKEVPSYDIQSSNVQYTLEQSKYDIGTDNNFHFEKEIQIMRSLFDIDLYDYDYIQNHFAC